MCLAVPAQVISLAGQEAEVDFGGVRRRISVVLTPQVRIGDYVLIHTGFAINVLDEEEARETLELFRELDEFSAPATEEPACTAPPPPTARDAESRHLLGEGVPENEQ
jgi:hydrogenase expression/formation protein HypC